MSRPLCTIRTLTTLAPLLSPTQPRQPMPTPPSNHGAYISQIYHRNPNHIAQISRARTSFYILTLHTDPEEIVEKTFEEVRGFESEGMVDG